jgi:hypothetical protein
MGKTLKFVEVMKPTATYNNCICIICCIMP